jgi:sirohydrochlorin cobaltochelatase
MVFSQTLPLDSSRRHVCERGVFALKGGVIGSGFADATLVILGHGTDLNARSSEPVFQHAAALRRGGCFGEVREAFWKQAPHVTEVLASLTASEVFIVPFFVAAGYFSEHVIPRELGFPMAGQSVAQRHLRRGDQSWFYCEPVGTHESITDIVLSRARSAVERFPFPRLPRASDMTLFLAGHGTDRNPNSSRSLQDQVDRIRTMGLYAETHALFLEEEPLIPKCYDLAATRNIVVVPFFTSEGLHVQEDIPVLLGQPERVVKDRLSQGLPGWRNPTERRGKMVWYADSIGTHPAMADIILARARQLGGMPSVKAA